MANEPGLEGFVDVTEQLDKAAVYVIVEVATGHKYIGSAQDFYERVNQHRHLLEKGTHHNSPLQKAFDDKAEFRYYVKLVDSREEAYDQEQVLLDRHHATGDAFNIATDARSPGKGRSLSPEHAEALRQARIGAVASEETREKLRQARLRNGDTLTAEGREKLRQVHTGRKHTDEARAKMSEKIRAHYAVHERTEEHTKKQSETQRNKARPVEIQGIRYRSVPDAAEALGLDVGAVRNHCNSTTERFVEWKFVDKEKSTC